MPAEGQEAGPGLLLLQLVTPPYANLASASWQVMDKPITDHGRVRNMAGGRSRRGQPPSPDSLSYLKTVWVEGLALSTQSLAMKTNVPLDFKGQALGLLAPLGRPWGTAPLYGSAWLGVLTLSRGITSTCVPGPESGAVWPHEELCALRDSQEQFSVGAGLGLGDGEARDWERLGAPQPSGAAGSPTGWQTVGERGSLALHRSSWGLHAHS